MEIDMTGFQIAAKNYAVKDITDLDHDELKAQCLSLGQILSDWINRSVQYEITVERCIDILVSQPSDIKNPEVQKVIRMLVEVKKRKPRPTCHK